jgi:predicted permease
VAVWILAALLLGAVVVAALLWAALRSARSGTSRRS